MKLSKVDLNFQFLFTFINLVEIKNYTLTAKALGMTQPGVSQHIRWLEDHFKVQLIVKIPKTKSFELTQEGEQVYKYGKSTFEQHELIKKSLEKDDFYQGDIRLAAPGSFGTMAFDFLLQYCSQYRALNPFFYYAPNRTIEGSLLNNDLGAGFMSVRPDSQELEAIKIDEEELFLLVPVRFKYSGLASLDDLGLIDHPDASIMVQNLFEKNFEKDFHSFSSLKVSGANNQITRILEPVSLGMGYTVLPEYAAKDFLKTKKVKKVILKKKYKSDVYFVFKRYKVLPNRYKSFLNTFVGKKIFDHSLII